MGQDKVASFFAEHWGSETMVSRGRVHRAKELSGYAAIQNEYIVALVTYDIRDGECEIVSLDSTLERQGIGTSLVRMVEEAARTSECRRLWLITSNDNLYALQFYQKLGFKLVAIHQGAIIEARKLKPEIPEIGLHGIPLRDEIELEYSLENELGDSAAHATN